LEKQETKYCDNIKGRSKI